MLKKLLGKNRQPINREVDELIKEIRNCEYLMARNEVLFDMTTDEDLIEAQIYERESLRYQYNYLLKQLRCKENQLCLESQKVRTGE
ncbi:MAG: DUF2508 family protein [Ruminococcaceae bacterium]|nr:DUF2508 family protein [Oscillospiraceae bacterium]